MKRAASTTSAGGVAAASGLVALLAMASCCAIPAAMAVAGLSGLSGIFIFGGEHHFVLTAISFLLILGGWAFYGWERWECSQGRCERPTPLGRNLLILATGLLVLALLFGPFIEPWVLAELRQWRR